jgi:hypothetical protein
MNPASAIDRISDLVQALLVVSRSDHYWNGLDSLILRGRLAELQALDAHIHGDPLRLLEVTTTFVLAIHDFCQARQDVLLSDIANLTKEAMLLLDATIDDQLRRENR